MNLLALTLLVFSFSQPSYAESRYTCEHDSAGDWCVRDSQDKNGPSSACRREKEFCEQIIPRIEQGIPGLASRMDGDWTLREGSANAPKIVTVTGSESSVNYSDSNRFGIVFVALSRQREDSNRCSYYDFRGLNPIRNSVSLAIGHSHRMDYVCRPTLDLTMGLELLDDGSLKVDLSNALKNDEYPASFSAVYKRAL